MLPWRRGTATPAELEPLLRAWRAAGPRRSAALIERAYLLAAALHDDQVRKTGDAYISHPLAVATIVAEQGLDDVTVAAALLHDAIEDTGLTLDELATQFGPEVAAVVDGVTKLERLRFDSREAQQAATMRKMLVAMAKDLRVLLIKLADRLHNMRTIAAMEGWKQQRTATETLEIYAPLAHRLGMAEMKAELEDLCFAVIEPKRYAEIEQMVEIRAPARDAYLSEVTAELHRRFTQLRIDADIFGRPKHLWSIYEKMVVKDREFDDIHDLIGVRVIVDSVRDCYAALGSIHSLWKPLQGRFKDYIAMPKFNLYQSLHTTVVGPAGKLLEIQIRTKEMHSRAEHGVASHWGYKDPSSAPDAAWLDRIVDWQAETTDPDEFMNALRGDLEQDEVFVFTPNGDVITLPAGATTVDFAYAVHTEVGHATVGARVNGRLVSLDTLVASGDTVEVFTSKVADAGPSRDWLKFVVTPRARNKIKQRFSKDRREDDRDAGREELMKELRREGLPVQKVTSSSALAELAETMNYSDVDALYAAVGQAHVSGKAVAQRLGRILREGSHAEERVPSTVGSRRHTSRRRSDTGIHVEGLDDVMVRLSRCCTPVPGDEIMGFVTRGRGVSVHRTDCSNAVSLVGAQGDRLIDVEWDSDPGAGFVVSIIVEALDRTRLLRDVSTALSEHHVNIVAAHTQTGEDRISRMQFDFELSDPSHLDSVLGTLRDIDSVYDCYRVLPGHAERAS